MTLTTFPAMSTRSPFSSQNSSPPLGLTCRACSFRHRGAQGLREPLGHRRRPGGTAGEVQAEPVVVATDRQGTAAGGELDPLPGRVEFGEDDEGVGQGSRPRDCRRRDDR